MDEVCLELHTSQISGRGFGLLFSVLMFGLSAAIVKFLFIDFGLDFVVDDFALSLGALGLTFVCILGAVYGIRTDTEAPREEPVRFNRKRGKVYVYRFHEGWVLSRKGWGVRPVVYNWDDLRAEAWSRMAPTTSAVPIFAWGVDIAVVQPGTNRVVDRFQLAGSNANGEHMWAMARAYMNQGPEALPKYSQPPRDWNNDVPWYNFALRLAPKVQWPADMDVESRTAP